jgi:hypothetical protein
MKKYILIIAVLFCTNLQAQSIDTVKNAIQVKPVVVSSFLKDTCYQVSWAVFGINRNDTTGGNSYVQLYDRVGKKVSELNIPIPYGTLRKWLDDIVIDDYILKYLGLQKK